MIDREKVIRGLECCSVQSVDRDCDVCQIGFGEGCALKLKRDALALLKAQVQIIKEMYSRYEDLCKKIRKEYESDDVCGLCQYDGAYIGDSGDWMNECPGFETSECFCMKNSIRELCGQPLIEEP